MERARLRNVKVLMLTIARPRNITSIAPIVMKHLSDKENSNVVPSRRGSDS